jgi:hypothetical protein
MEERLKNNTSPAKYFEEDFMAFSNYVERQIENRTSVFYKWDTYIDFAGGVEIPRSLLLGPWTEEMIRHLYWMVKGGAQLNWLTSTSGEVCSSYPS